ncbi:MAG: hypothetical protein M3R08_01715 [Bacteroidota bacterium]|nr:hypothetical protein [Bacteroidota bacterium]
MPRWLFSLLLVMTMGRALGQQVLSDSTAALTFTRSVSVPLNALMLFDRAMGSWTWTFGQEPGTKLLRSDREAGVIEGIARVNFRSEMLSNREESMGVIQYRIIINIKPGECRTVITELVHSGNNNSSRPAVHMGLLTRSLAPSNRIGTMGRTSQIKLYAEIKGTATERIRAVMQAFDSRLRSETGP